MKDSFLPNISEEEQERITPSELLLYEHALEYKWTVETALLNIPEFDSKEVDPDLHTRMDKAADDGLIKCFDMRDGPADLSMRLLISACGPARWRMLWRMMEDVVREIVEDPAPKGNLNHAI